MMCDWGFWWWFFPLLGLGMIVLCFGMMFLRGLFGWSRHRGDWCWPEPSRRETPKDEVTELREEIKALRREISSLKEHQKERPS